MVGSLISLDSALCNSKIADACIGLNDIWPVDIICEFHPIIVCIRKNRSASLHGLGLGWSALAVGLVRYFTRSVVYVTIEFPLYWTELV